MQWKIIASWGDRGQGTDCLIGKGKVSMVTTERIKAEIKVI
jgi:hypothetical protein